MQHKPRPASSADIQTYFGQPSPYTIKAQVWEIDGEIVGVAGYYLIGPTAMVFSDMRGDIPKMSVWRASKEFMKNLKFPVLCEGTEESAPFLKRLGWQPVPDMEGLFRWLP